MNFLVLGAGRVAGPAIDFLSRHGDVVVLHKPGEDVSHLGIEPPRVRFVEWEVDDEETLRRFLKSSAVMVSLLPAWMHARVVKVAISEGVSVVTASYVSEEMRALEEEARKKGVTVLNEMGVDPGIDHMSALRLINKVRSQGREVKGFWSYTGGLPAPSANNNPWGYKLSWSPVSVVRAALNPAVYLEDGTRREVPSPEVFVDVRTLHFEGIGTLESYPNRNSLIYKDLYGLKEAQTIYRGTLRYPGWCRLWYHLGKLGLLSLRPFEKEVETPAQAIKQLLGASDDLEREVAKRTGLDLSDEVMAKIRWIGLFDETPLKEEVKTPVDLLAYLMMQRLNYEEGEQDMIVMRHEFQLDDGKRLTSSLVVFGEENGPTAMAKTVGLPVGVGAYLVAQKKINRPGVVIPNFPEAYDQVLPVLEELGIKFEEVEDGKTL